MYDLNLAVIASTAGIAILAAIYLWSEHWPATPGLAAAQTPAPPLASLGNAHLARLGQARPAATGWMVRGPRYGVCYLG